MLKVRKTKIIILCLPIKNNHSLFCATICWSMLKSYQQAIGSFQGSYLIFVDSAFFFKVFLADSTGGAYPVFREVFKRCSRRNSSFRISFCRIVDVSAENAYISVHNDVVWSAALIQYSDRICLHYILNEKRRSDCSERRFA